jgi:tRNA threonylcarbamoyladenosine biosynthesis protein TsaE
VPSRVLTTNSPEATIALGRQIGAQLKPPLLILLSGDLGAGKTTLTKGIVSGIGAAREEEVTSPTFTLVHKYERNSGRVVPVVYHVDLYRVGDVRDLETLGLADLFTEDAIIIVEWPHKLALLTAWPVLRIHLEHDTEHTRRISIDADSHILSDTTVA